MKKVHRVTVSAFLAALITTTGCGGGSSLEEDSAAARTAASKGGHDAPIGVSMAVTPDPTTLNGTVTISLWPGSLAGQQLFINWVCNQNGAGVADGRSYELSYAVGNEAGYSWVTDHYEWQFVIPATALFTSGPASCWAKGLTYSRRSGYTAAAQANFSVQ